MADFVNLKTIKKSKTTPDQELETQRTKALEAVADIETQGFGQRRKQPTKKSPEKKPRAKSTRKIKCEGQF